MVYYRKYRPQTIAELDSTKVRETLTAVLSREDIPHAFLLTGPKGLGKTSTARIIAKVVNCENRKKGSIEPCNTCDSCISITNGTNIDVLEIDGASNRGIDEIRDLRDKVKLAPSHSKKKIYIIDEVHMLTTEAFNALLKTIEEPPAHVMFLFATTEPHKVPDTIISRCFHVMFPKATNEDIVHSLERIVKGEKLEVEKGVLEEIAKMADGGFRDATKILEEMVMVAGDKKIDVGFINSYYKSTNIQLFVTDFLAYIAAYNITGGLHKVQQLIEQGTDIKWFITEVLNKLNSILLAQLKVEGEITSYPENIRFDSEKIQKLFFLFSQAYQDTKYAVIPQLPLELAVVEWCSAEQNLIEPVIANEVKQSSPENEIASSSSTPRNDNKHTMDSLLKKEKNLKVQAVLRGSVEQNVKEKKETKINDSQEKLSEKQAAERLMDNLIFKVKPYNHSVAGVLRGCTITAITHTQVMFVTAYKFHKEKLDEIKTKQVLEQTLKEITGKNLKVMIELKEK